MKKDILTIFIILLIILGVGFGLVLPKYKELRELKDKINSKKREIENKREYFLQIKKSYEQLQKYQTELSKVSVALPSKFSLPFLFSFFQEMANSANLSLKNISYGKSNTLLNERGSSIKEIHFSLELGGSYENFKNFIKMLENSARLVDIDNVSVSVGGGEEGREEKGSEELSDIFNFKLNITTYSY